MRKGAYSNKFKALEKEEIHKLKNVIKSAVDQRKERERNIARETNQRRRYLTLKRKAQEDVEDKQRQQVLLERKEKQLEATLKFQRNQKNAAKENAKDKQTGTFPLRDGLYNIRGHLVEIKDGIRVPTTPLPPESAPMKGNSIQNDKKTPKKPMKNHVNGNQNALYSGKSYLLHHLNDLVHGQEKNREYSSGNEAVIENEARDNIRNEACGNQHNMKQKSDVVVTTVGELFNRVTKADHKMPPSDASVSSTDSLETIKDASTNNAPKTPKSNLKIRNCFSSEKEKRKVKFNSSIEFNDGFVWMLKDNEQKPTNKFNSPSAASQSKSGIVKKEFSTVITNTYSNASFAPALPRFDDYSYPDSVDLSKPLTTEFAKKSNTEKKIENRPKYRTLPDDVSSSQDMDFSPLDSLEIDNKEVAPSGIHAANPSEQALKDAASRTAGDGDTQHAPHMEQGIAPRRQKDPSHFQNVVKVDTLKLTSQPTSFQTEQPNVRNELPTNTSNQQALPNHRPTSISQELYRESKPSLAHAYLNGITREDSTSLLLNNHPRDIQNNPTDQQAQSRFHHEASSQGYNEHIQQPLLQNLKSSTFSEQTHPRLFNNPATPQLYHRTDHDRSSFLNVRGDAYFPERPSFQGGTQNAMYIDPRTMQTQGICEYSKYQSSSEMGLTTNDSLVNATSGLHNRDHFSMTNNSNTDQSTGILAGPSGTMGMAVGDRLATAERGYKVASLNDGEMYSGHVAGHVSNNTATTAAHSGHNNAPGDGYNTSQNASYNNRPTAGYDTTHTFSHNHIENTSQKTRDNTGHDPYLSHTNHNAISNGSYNASTSRTHNMNYNQNITANTRPNSNHIPSYSTHDNVVNNARSGDARNSEHSQNTSVAYSGSSRTDAEIAENSPASYHAVSAIDINQLLSNKNDQSSTGGSNLDDDDDDIISNVRKSMAELKFSAKWEPNSNVNNKKFDSNENKDLKVMERPGNKAKLLETDTWVSENAEIKKQSKIESTNENKTEKKSNIPVRSPSLFEKTNTADRKVSTAKARQKADLVPHPPPGPKGRLFPRKRAPENPVTKRGSPMKVINPNRPRLQSGQRTETQRVNNYVDYDDDYDNYAGYTNSNKDQNADWSDNQNLRNNDLFTNKQNNNRIYDDSKINPSGNGKMDENSRNNHNINNSLNKTPTDDEINDLWYDVKSCLKTKPSQKASSDSVYISSPWRQQRTWSGSGNGNARQADYNQNFRRFQNKNATFSSGMGSNLPLRRYGSHENLRRENSLDNLAGNVKIRGRSARLPQRKKKITPSVQAFALRKSMAGPEPMLSNQTPNVSKSRAEDMSESLASFLALETMCQEESLSPYRTSAVLKASQNAYKEIKGDPRRDDDSPVFFNESRRQGPSALSIEERKVMESLERLNSRLREKETAKNKHDAALRWNSPLISDISGAGASQAPSRNSRTGNSAKYYDRNTRGHSVGSRQGKYRS